MSSGGTIEQIPSFAVFHHSSRAHIPVPHFLNDFARRESNAILPELEKSLDETPLRKCVNEKSQNFDIDRIQTPVPGDVWMTADELRHQEQNFPFRLTNSMMMLFILAGR
jgi:hypothetical protein